MSTPILEDSMEDLPISAAEMPYSVETAAPESDTYITPNTMVLPPQSTGGTQFDQWLSGLENTWNSLFPILQQTGVINTPNTNPAPATQTMPDNTARNIIIAGAVFVAAILILRKTS